MSIFPEGGSVSGRISLCNGKFSIDSLAENDRHQIYAMKLLRKIREMASNGVFEEEGMIAWY
jgi:hypothetical protein